MVKAYSQEPALPAKAAKSSASDLRIHYKNTYETARAVRGMHLRYGIKYLKDVIAQKRCVPFRVYNGHVGRTGQAKEFGTSQGRWPVKSAKAVLSLLQNLEANANVKNLDIDKLVISHVQVNRAQKGRRRTYRAHGRINPYLSSHCHIEIFATLKDEDVKKERNKKHVGKLTKKTNCKNKT